MAKQKDTDIPSSIYNPTLLQGRKQTTISYFTHCTLRVHTIKSGGKTTRNPRIHPGVEVHFHTFYGYRYPPALGSFDVDGRGREDWRESQRRRPRVKRKMEGRGLRDRGCCAKVQRKWGEVDTGREWSRFVGGLGWGGREDVISRCTSKGYSLPGADKEESHWSKCVNRKKKSREDFRVRDEWSVYKKKKWKASTILIKEQRVGGRGR